MGCSDQGRKRGAFVGGRASTRGMSCGRYGWTGTAVRRSWCRCELADPVPGAGEVVVRAEAVDTIFVETQIRGGWGESFGVRPAVRAGRRGRGDGRRGGRGGGPGLAGPPGGGAPRGRRGRTRNWSGSRWSCWSRSRTGLESAEAAALAHDGVTGSGIVEGVGIKRGRPGADPGRGRRDGDAAGADRGGGGGVRGGGGAGRAEAGADPGAGRRPGGGLHGAGLDRGGRRAGGRPAGRGRRRAGPGRVRAGPRTAGGSRRTAPPAAASPSWTRRRRSGARSPCAGSRTSSSRRRRSPGLAGHALAEAAAGRLRPVIARTFPLAEAAQAHRAIEAREIPGKALLIP